MSFRRTLTFFFVSLTVAQNDSLSLHVRMCMSTTIRVGRMQVNTADNNSQVIYFNVYKITKNEYLFISTFLVKETTQVSKNMILIFEHDWV